MIRISERRKVFQAEKLRVIGIGRSKHFDAVGLHLDAHIPTRNMATGHSMVRRNSVTSLDCIDNVFSGGVYKPRAPTVRLRIRHSPADVRDFAGIRISADSIDHIERHITLPLLAGPSYPTPLELT